MTVERKMMTVRCMSSRQPEVVWAALGSTQEVVRLEGFGVRLRTGLPLLGFETGSHDDLILYVGSHTNTRKTV